MEPGFWHERWSRGQVGFHQERVNPLLDQWWPSCGVASGAKVLVPLCGKSLDLRWLASRGAAVTGVELSPLAVAALFTTSDAVTSTPEGALMVWRDSEIEVLEGDFFEVGRSGFDAFWDRAATIALPRDLRWLYAERLADLVGTGAVGLLVGLTHAGESGPPFSVPPEEVASLYGAHFRVELLGDPVPAGSPSGPATEQVYKLIRR